MPWALHSDTYPPAWKFWKRPWSCGACGKRFRKVESAIEHEEGEHGGLQLISTGQAVIQQNKRKVSTPDKIKGLLESAYFLARFK